MAVTAQEPSAASSVDPRTGLQFYDLSHPWGHDAPLWPSDTVVKAGFGARLAVLGPIENADLVGLDLTLDIHSYVLPRLDPPSEPARGLRERVERGELGMRTGSGYRDWTPEAADEVRRRLREHLVAVWGMH